MSRLLALRLAALDLPTRRAQLQIEDKEAGMSTAEYAVGTVAACGFGMVLYKLLTSEGVLGILRGVITKAFEVF